MNNGYNLSSWWVARPQLGRFCFLLFSEDKVIEGVKNITYKRKNELKVIKRAKNIILLYKKWYKVIKSEKNITL